MDALIEQIKMLLDWECIDPNNIVITDCELSNAVYFSADEKEFAIILTGR